MAGQPEDAREARRTARARAAGRAAAVALALATPAAAVGAAPIRFSFAPPEGGAYLRMTAFRRRVETPAGAQSAGYRATVRVEIRREADGYALERIPVSVRREGGEGTLSDPTLALLEASRLTFHISRDGALDRIDGLARAAERARAGLPPAAGQALAPLLRASALEARARAEWKGRVGDFVGRSAEIGDVWNVDAPFALPDGPVLRYRGRISFAGRVACPAGSCVRIEFRYDSGAPPDGGEPEPAGRPRVRRVRSRGYRVVDPATMVVYAEDVSRVVDAIVRTGERAVPVATREEKHVTILPLPSARPAPGPKAGAAESSADGDADRTPPASDQRARHPDITARRPCASRRPSAPAPLRERHRADPPAPRGRAPRRPRHEVPAHDGPGQ